jgi:hypothetical protein
MEHIEQTDVVEIMDKIDFSGQAGVVLGTDLSNHIFTKNQESATSETEAGFLEDILRWAGV